MRLADGRPLEERVLVVWPGIILLHDEIISWQASLDGVSADERVAALMHAAFGQPPIDLQHYVSRSFPFGYEVAK